MGPLGAADDGGHFHAGSHGCHPEAEESRLRGQEAGLFLGRYAQPRYFVEIPIGQGELTQTIQNLGGQILRKGNDARADSQFREGFDLMNTQDYKRLGKFIKKGQVRWLHVVISRSEGHQATRAARKCQQLRRGHSNLCQRSAKSKKADDLTVKAVKVARTQNSSTGVLQHSGLSAVRALEVAEDDGIG